MYFSFFVFLCAAVYGVIKKEEEEEEELQHRTFNDYINNITV